MGCKESVLDRQYEAVIYATLLSVQAATVGFIITVDSTQIESMHFMAGLPFWPITNVA